MRRNLSPAELGDLFDRPLVAVLALARPDGRIMQTPIWHQFRDGRLWFQVPAGDRKIPMLERGAPCSLVIAENERPYRGFEVEGRAVAMPVDYRVFAAEICQRYVDAWHPGAPVEAYMSEEPGLIVSVEPQTTRAWDYADDFFV